MIDELLHALAKIEEDADAAIERLAHGWAVNGVTALTKIAGEAAATRAWAEAVLDERKAVA